ncbi:MAG TPA: FecR family protein [Bryobacteraceae bacterium]
MKRAILAVVLAAAVFAQIPGAQGPGPQGPGNFPPPGGAPGGPADTGAAPNQGVARLSLIQGNVSVRHGDAADLSAGVMNAPLMAGDRVATGDGGRAEIQFDALNVMRLAFATEVRISELRYKQYQIQIAQGAVMFHVVRDNDARAEISTPTVLVHPARQGSYRITVNADGTTEIAVRSGQAEVFGPTGSEFVNAGQTMLARGSASDPEVQVVASAPLDEFDRWNADRDRAFDRVSSTRNVPPEVAGTETLDQNGRWQYDPQYGQVWVPSVDPGWAPYQNGSWVDESYYGWTWVGVEPWGWAPYHYGRWYSSPWGWAWYPGPLGLPFYYSPALVGFFGWGPGVGFGIGFGFGFGNVGWVALAPFEAFHPWYGVGAVGLGRAAIVGNANVTAMYRNARVANAVAGMRTADFGRMGVTRANMVRASSADLARAGSVRGALAIPASQASHRFSNAAVSTRGMPQTSSNMRFSSAGSKMASATSGARSAGGSSAGSNGGWRSFNPSSSASRGYSAQAAPRSSAPASQGAGPRYSAPPAQGGRYSAPSSDPRGSSGAQGRGYSAPQQQQRVQVNPPVVRDRESSGSSSAPRSSGGSSRGGGGSSRGGGRR